MKDFVLNRQNDIFIKSTDISFNLDETWESRCGMLGVRYCQFIDNQAVLYNGVTPRDFSQPQINPSPNSDYESFKSSIF